MTKNAALSELRSREQLDRRREAGLSYTHKAGQPNEGRLAGLIDAAANLKRYAAAFKLPLPTNVGLLYDED